MVASKLGLLSWASRVLGSTIGDGQCVALSEAWLANCGKPHIWGNAVDLLANAPANQYRVVPNQPNNAPSPGDVLVWDGSWGGGFGHTAVVLAANANEAAVIEQNDPTGRPAVIATHGYGGVKGWLTW